MTARTALFPLRSLLALVGVLVCIRIAWVDLPQALDGNGWSPHTPGLLAALIVIAGLLVRGPVARARSRSPR